MNSGRSNKRLWLMKRVMILTLTMLMLAVTQLTGCLDTDGNIVDVSTKQDDQIKEKRYYEYENTNKTENSGCSLHIPLYDEYYTNGDTAVTTFDGDTSFEVENVTKVESGYVFQTGYLYTPELDYRNTDDVGTISIWFNAENTTSWQNLFSMCSETSNLIFFKIQIHPDYDGQVGFGYGRSNGYGVYVIAETVDLRDQRWHNYVLSCNGTGYQVYVDGQETGQYLVGTPYGFWLDDLWGQTDNIVIGARKNTSGMGLYFSGVIGEVEYYDECLTYKQIRLKYFNEKRCYQ